jgi:hypothetical protein
MSQTGVRCWCCRPAWISLGQTNVGIRADTVGMVDRGMHEEIKKVGKATNS